MEKKNKQILGAALAGLFTGVLAGYVIGVNRNAQDEKFLSDWMKNNDYEDGNVFGYETSLPAEYFGSPRKAMRAQRQSLK